MLRTCSASLHASDSGCTAHVQEAMAGLRGRAGFSGELTVGEGQT